MSYSTKLPGFEAETGRPTVSPNPTVAVVGLVRSQEHSFALGEKLSSRIKLLKAQWPHPADPCSCEAGAVDWALEVYEELDRIADGERPVATEAKPTVAEIHQSTDFATSGFAVTPN